MPSFAVSAIGRDRPGIVAAVAEVLYQQGCNVEDSSMTLLRGNFAMMLVVAGPDGLDAGGLERALRPACERLGMVQTVREVEDTAEHARPSHILTVYGADHPGILYRITEAIAALEVNITDLDSRLVGSEDSPVYALMLELALGAHTDVDGMETGLRELAKELGVEVSLHELDEDIL